MLIGRKTLAAAAAAALMTVLLAPAAELGAAGEPAGSIAYQTLRSGRWRIAVMNSDKSGKTLLPGKGNSTAPVWLPDGRILFNSDRSGKWKIYTMAANGSGVTAVTTGTKAEEHAGVALGGKLLLVRRGARSYLIRDLDTMTSKPLSFASFPGTGGEFWPSLSPDGTKIAFLFKNGSGAKRAVYAASVTEEATKYLVGPATKVAVGCFSSWAPDSSGFLMCIIKNDAEGSDLYLATANPDGTWTKTRKTTAVNWDYFPAWSPDGGWIVWGASPVKNHAFESPTYEIWSMPAAGGVPVRLTKDAYADNAPSWSLPPLP